MSSEAFSSDNVVSEWELKSTMDLPDPELALSPECAGTSITEGFSPRRKDLVAFVFLVWKAGSKDHS